MRQWDNQKRRFSGLSDASWSYSKLYQMLTQLPRSQDIFITLNLRRRIGLNVASGAQCDILLNCAIEIFLLN